MTIPPTLLNVVYHKTPTINNKQCTVSVNRIQHNEKQNVPTIQITAFCCIQIRTNMCTYKHVYL